MRSDIKMCEWNTKWSENEIKRFDLKTTEMENLRTLWRC